MRIVTLMAVLAGVLCVGLMTGGQVFAEDPAANSGVTAPEGAPAESAVDGEGEGEEEDESGPLAEPDTEEAIERVQAYAYDESVLYGTQTPPGMFLRLAEDYLITSEIGTRTIAHIPLWPRGSVRLGPFQLFPYLTTSYTWVDTNLDEDYHDETDTSSYGAVGGGVAGQTVTMNGKATFTFGLDYRYNMYNGGEKESEIMGGAGVRYSFTPRMWVAAGVRWEHLVDPIGIEDRGDAERDNFYPYVDFGLGDALGSKVQIEFGVDFTSTDYSDSEYETGSYGEWNAHVKVAVPFYRETTRLYVRYDYFFGDSESDRLNDLSGGHQISGGMEGMIPLTRTGRLEGFAEMGYRQNGYESSHYYKDGSDYIETDDSDDEGTWTSAVGLRYHLGMKTTIEVHALRSMEYSSHGNYRVVERIDGWLTRMLTRDLIGRLGAFYERSNPSGSDSEGGDSEERWGVGAGLRFVATEFLDLFLDADYTNTSDQNNDEDTGYELRLTIGTDIYLW